MAKTWTFLFAVVGLIGCGAPDPGGIEPRPAEPSAATAARPAPEATPNISRCDDGSPCAPHQMCVSGVCLPCRGSVCATPQPGSAPEAIGDVVVPIDLGCILLNHTCVHVQSRAECASLHGQLAICNND